MPDLDARFAATCLSPGQSCPGTAVVAPLDQPFISFGATRPKHLMAMGPGGSASAPLKAQAAMIPVLSW